MIAKNFGQISEGRDNNFDFLRFFFATLVIFSFGTFSVRKTKARKGLNPRTGEAIKVKAGKTVRFKASPTLKKAV